MTFSQLSWLSLTSTSPPRTGPSPNRESDNKKWREKTRDLEDLEIGTPVAIQNQTGKIRQELS